MSIRPALLLLSLCLAVSACGKEAGRIRLPAEGSGAAVVVLEAGEVSFWTDLDIQYEGDAKLEYVIDLFQKGSSVGKATCNPLGQLPAKTGWVETNIGSSHSRRGNGKMECSAKLAADGETMVKTTLAFGTKPKTVTLKKADLVIKQ
jgi:hypothetical protein